MSGPIISKITTVRELEPSSRITAPETVIRTPQDVGALVPLRSLGEDSKTRLAGWLSAGQRADLITAMFTDVLDALHGANIGSILVLAGDDSAVELARDLGIPFVVDDPLRPGLNSTVMAAMAASDHERDALVVMPDLPMLTPRDITTVVTSQAAVAVAPSSDGGTGGLLCSRRVRLPLAFGLGSASRHAVACLASGVRFEWCRVLGFAQDIDTADDLFYVDGSRVGLATARLLEQPGFRRPIATAFRKRFGHEPEWARTLGSRSG